MDDNTKQKRNKKKKKKKDVVPRNERSLLLFVQALEDVPLVCVETRDDSILRGVVKECDDAMNVTLANAEKITVDGETSGPYDVLFLRNRMIRGIHVPGRYDACELMEKKRWELFRARTYYERMAVHGELAGKERLPKGEGIVEGSVE